MVRWKVINPIKSWINKIKRTRLTRKWIGFERIEIRAEIYYLNGAVISNTCDFFKNFAPLSFSSTKPGKRSYRRNQELTHTHEPKQKSIAIGIK